MLLRDEQTHLRCYHVARMLIPAFTIEIGHPILRGLTCIGKFDGNASEYARCSLSANVGGGNVKHSEATIRQFVGVAVTALTKYDTINGVCEALVSEKHGNRVFPSMLDVRALLAGNGQRAVGKKVAKKFVAKTEAKKYTKAQLSAMLATK